MDWLYELSRVPRYFLNIQTLLIVLAVFGLIGSLVLPKFWKKLGQRLLQLLAVLTLLLAFLPFDDWLLSGLEKRFTRPSDTALVAQSDQLAGVIVLGGAVSVSASQTWQQAQSNGAAERLFEGMRLANLIGNKPLLYASGGRTRATETLSEAAWAAQLMQGLGFPRERLLLEEKSLSTRENALFSREVVTVEQLAQTWILITSAKHMPRSVGVFQKEGWQVLPYPVDFESQMTWKPFRQDLGLRLFRFDRALKEWIGLLYYRVRGWSDDLFPGPDSQPTA
ncbi:YdcF family protein [Rhodovibrionaceae bacterium A322]